MELGSWILLAFWEFGLLKVRKFGLEAWKNQQNFQRERFGEEGVWNLALVKKTLGAIWTNFNTTQVGERFGGTLLELGRATRGQGKPRGILDLTTQGFGFYPFPKTQGSGGIYNWGKGTINRGKGGHTGFPPNGFGPISGYLSRKHHRKKFVGGLGGSKFPSQGFGLWVFSHNRGGIIFPRKEFWAG